MKRRLLLLLTAFALFQAASAQRICGTTESEQFVRSNDEKYDLRRQQIENYTNDFIAHGGGLDRALVTIPVVVHVVWNTATENISDAQVQSQIDVLNADFRKLNADASSVPSAFAGLAADANIEFCLATVDPNGNPTNGITRTQTATTAFGTNDQVKSASTGGVNAWSRDQYLNIWVCDISGGILGYAQFPGGAASTDGVVCDYQYFGTNGTATAPFNKGRTATHEVGHWLNLFHIWGDDGTGCTGSDQVADTPNAAGPNYGCPTFPNVTCSNGPNGDMFMNYMDYTDDACMYMFSNAQAARMAALFATGGFRAPLLNSTACGPVSNVCAVPGGRATSAITAAGATFTWTASASAASYNVRYKASTATVWTNVTGLTSASYTVAGLTGCTAYEWQVQSVCDATTSSAFSASTTFSTTGCAPSYCTSVGLSTADEFINRVVIGTIDNTSGNNSGYGNFTSLATTLSTNNSFAFSGTPGYTATAFTEFWRVWIDFNADLDFDDAGELVYTSAGSTTTVNGTIAIPSTATIGSTRMRVSMKYNAVATQCESFQYGEVEDYTVNIIAGTAPTPCNAPTGLAISGISQNGATASWAAASGAVSYNFQFKLNSATTWTTVSTTTPSYTFTGLTAGTTYNTRVATVCSNGTSANSAQVNFTTTAAPTCGTPTGLATSGITTSGATSTWTAVSGAVSYNFQFKLNTATTWTTVSTTSNTYTFTGLTAGTTYNTRVATVCSFGTSANSTQVNFTTTAVVACTDSYETNNTYNQAKSIAVNSNITAVISSSTDKDYFRFSTTTSNRNIKIDLTNLPADYDVILYNPSGVQIGISQTSGTANETIIYNNGPVGTYRLQVYGFNGAFNSTSCYTLRANRSNTAFRVAAEGVVMEEGEEMVESEKDAFVVENAVINTVNVYPNPTSDNIDVTFESSENTVVRIQMFDLMGREIHNSQMQVVTGFNITNIDMNEFARGCYTMMITNGDSRESIRVIKQ